MGVGIYKIYDAVVILSILIAYSTALNHLVLCKGKLDGLYAVAVLIVCRQYD